MSDVYYCDDYETVTGRDRDGTLGPTAAQQNPDPAPHEVEAKIITSPDPEPANASSVAVETSEPVAPVESPSSETPTA